LAAPGPAGVSLERAAFVHREPGRSGSPPLRCCSGCVELGALMPRCCSFSRAVSTSRFWRQRGAASAIARVRGGPVLPPTPSRSRPFSMLLLLRGDGELAAAAFIDAVQAPRGAPPGRSGLRALRAVRASMCRRSMPPATAATAGCWASSESAMRHPGPGGKQTWRGNTSKPLDGDHRRKRPWPSSTWWKWFAAAGALPLLPGPATSPCRSAPPALMTA